MRALVVLAACLGGSPEHTPKVDGPPRPARVDVPVEGPGATPRFGGDSGDTGEPPVDPPYVCPPEGVEPDPECGIVVERTSPTDRASDVDVFTSVSFWLSGADPTARIGMDEVPGRSRVLGERVEFTPEAPLSAATEHTARLCSCGVESTITFTTGHPLGTPVSDPTTLAGRTWTLDLAAGRLRAPAGLDTLFAPYLRAAVLLEVTDAPATALAVRTGWTRPGVSEQDPCSPTTDLTADFTVNPNLVAGPADGWFPNVVPTRAEGVIVTGTWTWDGERLVDATWSGVVDTAPWAALADPEDPGSFCAALAPLGGTCEACRDGSTWCLRMTIEALEGRDGGPSPLAAVPAPCDAR